MTRGRLWPAIVGGWLLASAVLCLVMARAIAALQFPDPDDAMRLLEVRDWLAGQSWWDVSQHRLNGGHFQMHWSRLVDLPLALVMTLVDPLVSRGVADRVAMTIVPLATLLAVMAGAAMLTARLAGEREAKLALLLTPLSIPLLYQVRPTRIDHHGWQIALVIAAMVALTGPRTSGRGLYAGMALATLVTISLEGLPIAVVIAAAMALSWAFDPDRRQVLRALVGSLFGVALILHVATRGPGALTASCDAISPAWLAALGVAAIGVTLATVAPLASVAARLAALVGCAAASAGTLVVLAPACVRGPFASLDPLVRTLWYEQVSEGLPLWHQPLDWAVITVALPLVGIVGAVRALGMAPPERRADWGLLVAVLVPGFVLSCLVNRTGATANALALPGAASLLLSSLVRARAVPALPTRLAATTGAYLLASPGLVAVAAFWATGVWPPTAQGSGHMRRTPCARFDQVRALGQLPAGTIFLPIDVTPDLIATTDQKAVSGGYHRNVAAMHEVLAAFTSPPAVAERIVRASGADYVAGCPDLNETRLYDAVSPHGLWARLENGEQIAWLRPIAIAGSPVLAWRVLPVK